MKHIIALIFFCALNAQAENITTIHNNCWDGSFGYNYLTVQESDEHVIFKTHGMNIFTRPEIISNRAIGSVRVETTAKIPKEDCVFSEDKLLVSCWSHKADVQQTWFQLNPDTNRREQAIHRRQASLTPIELNYVESAQLSRNGYEFQVQEFLVNGDQRRGATFRGSRSSACHGS
ncbi:MAG: hypothetical protein R2827_01600 [Bdellovibrionales bacterium]